MYALCVVQLKGISPTDKKEIEKHVEFVEDRPFNDVRYSMDSTRLHQLGWTPRVSWEEGITQTSQLFSAPPLLAF